MKTINTSQALLSALIERVRLLLPYASNTECEKTFDLISNFTRLASQRKDRRLARPPIDLVSIESLLADGSSSKKR
jgi:hypothetical protein